eukprot:CAMPEP_0194136156 /NCGR_PEP_ID=MMETSP0152-20130528/6175_1 /TAXON_ID=1049557 /ORGANISM="Thalassiothrix antarctica, Strain L6-D1" /LENGTH=59 /DNA_ID=CAMNT_0038832683 /DNA_START=297 /DNA_END=476 /DNA_ORIENTATION=+
MAYPNTIPAKCDMKLDVFQKTISATNNNKNGKQLSGMLVLSLNGTGICFVDAPYSNVKN